METEAPKDLHALEYSRHILDAVLGWPAKGNIELMADCLTAIQSSRKLPTAWHAHKYMLRAIELAKSQGIEVHRMWFMNGEYTNIRPEKVEAKQESVIVELSADDMELMKKYEVCLKCRGLDDRPESQCNCSERIKVAARQQRGKQQ